MWSAVGILRRTAFSAVSKGSPTRSWLGGYRCLTVEPTEKKGKEKAEEEITVTEARKLMRLVNVDEMKKKLGCNGNEETVSYTKLIEASQGLGIARSVEEAHAFARILDDAGVILIFRDKVYLHPDKVVELIRKAVPLGLNPEDDPAKVEFDKLRRMKEEIDVLAHKQVRKILWCGLGYSVVQIGLFFRLTFWEFSWDVMEPITFFTTATGIIVGYAYDKLKKCYVRRRKGRRESVTSEVKAGDELAAQ